MNLSKEFIQSNNVMCLSVLYIMMDVWMGPLLRGGCMKYKIVVAVVVNGRTTIRTVVHIFTTITY